MTFYHKLFLRLAYILSLFVSCSLGYAQVRLPKVFGSNMVLQRGVAIPVWGSAKPKSQIVVEIKGKRVRTVAASDGKWKVLLPAMPAGGPYVMSFYDHAQPSVRLVNVLIGDVWVASGQSNMEFQVQQLLDPKVEIKKAKYPLIRFFNVPHDKKIHPQDTISGGSWVSMDTNHVKSASAVAYFFARNLQAELNVPIGIIQSTWGGTPVEAWTSREQLLTSATTRNKIIQNDTIKPSHFVQDSLDLIRFWDIVYHPQQNTSTTIPKTDYNDKDWAEVNMPVTFKRDEHFAL